MAKMSSTLVGAAIVLAGIIATAVPSGAAPAAALRVGPHQSFAGLVNGHAGNATIEVLCPGPLRINQTGNPVAGQTVAVESPTPVAAVVGYTGTRARSIAATLIAPATTTAAGVTLTFERYGSQPIPTTVLLPCLGTATMVFSPQPTSPTARVDRVKVTFEPTCGAPACPLDRP
jgi:hypothetical protein